MNRKGGALRRLFYWWLYMNKIYFAIAAIVILICGYFGLNFWLLDKRSPRNSMTESLGLDPYELKTYPTNPDLSNRDLSKPLVVFFGDSRTAVFNSQKCRHTFVNWYDLGQSIIRDIYLVDS